jgi:hypothetical protein
MSGIERYLKHEQWYIAGMLVVFLLIETSINATSLLMEAGKEGKALAAWVPFVLEYTSGLSLFILFPMVAWYLRRFPLDWPMFRRNVGWHVLGSVAFTVLHIALMTGLRKPLFRLADSSYELDAFSWELLYEYRKDAWTYVFILLVIHIYRFIISRLRGEASLVDEGEDSVQGKVPDRLLVKKLGKEFIVRVDEIEWLESSGNYVNLHIGKRLYPVRSTLSGLVEQLEPRGFRRIHRSHAVNLDCVTSISPLESGDASLTLRNGTTLALSRRYRNAFREQLELTSG